MLTFIQLAAAIKQYGTDHRKETILALTDPLLQAGVNLEKVQAALEKGDLEAIRFNLAGLSACLSPVLSSMFSAGDPDVRAHLGDVLLPLKEIDPFERISMELREMEIAN